MVKGIRNVEWPERGDGLTYAICHGQGRQGIQ